MGKFTGYLICTDCDGTLTYEQGKLSDENAKAIKYFQEEGGLFTLATGRFPDHAKLFREKFHSNAPIVSLNGTILYDEQTGNLLNKWPMNKKDCFELLSYIHKTWPEVGEYWLNGLKDDGKTFESSGFIARDHHSDSNALREYMDKLSDTQLKMVIIQHEDMTPIVQKDLKQKFGDRFCFDSSWANGIEINSVDSGKGVAVQYLKEHLDSEIHTTVGVGDYENDITLLKCADIGYAVGNALDSVKAVADRITVRNTENAIAKIISDLGQF